MVPTKRAANAPPTVNIFVLIATKNIIAIINSKIKNSIGIFFINKNYLNFKIQALLIINKKKYIK